MFKYRFNFLQSQNIYYTLFLPSADKTTYTEAYSDVHYLGSESMNVAYLTEKQII